MGLFILIGFFLPKFPRKMPIDNRKGRIIEQHEPRSSPADSAKGVIRKWPKKWSRKERRGVRGNVDEYMDSPSYEGQIPFLCDEKHCEIYSTKYHKAMRPVIEVKDIGRNRRQIRFSCMERAGYQSEDHKDSKGEEIRKNAKKPGELSLLYFRKCGNGIRPQKMGQDVHLFQLPKDHLL